MLPAICEATAEDLSAICLLGQEVNLLHHEAWPQIFAAPSDPTRDAPHWQQSIANPNATTFVVEHASQIIAFITVFLVTESGPLLQPVPFARVGSICVGARHRGRGIGKALMAQAERWALERGASDMRLNVWAFNQAALRFYEELGYGVRLHSPGKALSRAA
jgi:GNAT superfamily N-acetyltransferase